MVGGVAADPSGGATSTSAGMVLDGTDDTVTISSIALNFPVITFEAYVNATDSINNSDTIFSYSTIGLFSIVLKPYIQIPSYTTSTDYAVFGSKNTMFHFVVVIDDKSTSLYLDGVLYGSVGHVPSITGSHNLVLGYGTNYWPGTIAFFRIWDGTALSASDVARLYAHRNAIGPGLQIHSNNELALGITQNTLSMPRYNLVMEAKNNVGVAISTQPTYAWEFRDATGNAVVNDWVSGVAATPTNMTDGSTSEGMVFDGANDYVDLPAISFGGGSMTVEMFFNLDTIATNERIFSFFTNNSDWFDLRFASNSGTLTFNSTTSSSVTITSTLSTNVWIHLTMVIDDPNNQIIFYKDGSVLETESASFTVPSGSRANGALFAFHDGANNYGDGILAFLRIYDGTALSASDVATLYAHRESKAVGYGFNVCGKSALSVAPSAAEVAGSLSVGGAVEVGGRVGIGRVPDCPLHVDGTEAFGNSLGGTYYRITTNAYANQSADRPLMCNIEGRTGVSELVVYSDERIKKNIVDLSDNEALETLRLIEPKKYEYVDQILRTNNTVYGYIAQQIKEVLPYAVQEIRNKVVPNVYSYADISSELVYTEASDISAVSTVGISTIYVDVSNVNTSAEVSMNVVMVEQSDISQNAVFSEAELEDGTKVHKLTFNDGYNTSSLHESSDILRVMDASNQEYHITITNIETSYRVEIDEDLSSLVNAQGELFVAGQQVPQNVYKLVFSTFDTATLDASSTTLKLVDASDATQYVSIASVLDSSTLQIDDDLQYMVPDSSNQLFVYGQKVSKSVSNLTFDASYNVRSISSNAVSLKVIDANAQEQYVNVHTKESVSNRLVLDEDISGKISYGASGELFVQGQKIQSTKHILTIQNYDTVNLDASSTCLCLYDYNNVKHEVSIVSVIDGSNIEISQDPTSFAHEGQVFVYGQKVDDFHTLSKEYINVVTLSAVQELDRALTKVTEEKDELQTKYDALEARVLALEGVSST
jgi:hypothetical protein